MEYNGMHTGFAEEWALRSRCLRPSTPAVQNCRHFARCMQESYTYAYHLDLGDCSSSSLEIEEIVGASRDRVHLACRNTAISTSELVGAYLRGLLFFFTTIVLRFGTIVLLLLIILIKISRRT